MFGIIIIDLSERPIYIDHHGHAEYNTTRH